MIIGSGNDRSTAHIVLDIPGADPNLYPVVPYLVLVKMSRLENQWSVLVRAIVVNEIRRCCLCTSLTRFVFLIPQVIFFFHL